MSSTDMLMVAGIVAAGLYFTNNLCTTIPLNLCPGNVLANLIPTATAAAPAAPAAASAPAPAATSKGYPAGYSAAAYRSYAAHVSVA
jgi:hypothetical protein